MRTAALVLLPFALLACRDDPGNPVYPERPIFVDDNDDFLDGETKENIERDLLKQVSSNYDVETMLISARTKENIDALRTRLVNMVREQYAVRYPYKTVYF